MTHQPSSNVQSDVFEALAQVGYRVLHVLGSGSGGYVYKALQLTTGQAVAVKLLALDELDTGLAERRIERFRREIGICSGLYHPDIVRLIDSGELDCSRYYAVFEYIPGQTLASLIAEEGMLRIQRARALMSQLLAPLIYAHSKGIAHRDLKPSNIMVTSDGSRDRIKILDFGISIRAGGERGELERLTLSHEWIGTPAYAAPEQLRGESAGAKSDLYAWGLIFTECITGTALVRGTSLAEIIEHQLHSSPHALPGVLRQHRLGGLLARVLEKDPVRRPGDASLILSLLDRISTQDIEDAHGYLVDTPRSGVRPIGIVLSDTLTGPRQHEEVERRDLIVVCCKLVLPDGGADADLEQYLERCDATLDDTSAVISEVMDQFGATHRQTLGDCSVAYFGMAPTRDADARLAVRMALELVNRLHSLRPRPEDPSLTVRAQIGIHAGPITVQVADGRRTPLGGLTTRFAVDLASLARSRQAHPTWILVSDSFRRQASRHAELAPHAAVAPFPFRGAQAAIFELLGESRSSGLRSERPVFVGRETELREVLAALEDPPDLASRHVGASGAAVLIRGEAGIGKTRFALELIARLQGLRPLVLEARCLPEWQSASMRPLVMLFLQQMGLVGSTPEDAGRRIDIDLRQLGLNAAEAVPLFCGWLGAALPPGYTPLAWSPQKQRQLLHQLVADALLARLDGKGVILIEDLQWADPSTLECLNVLLRRCKSRAALVVLTTRPDTELEWSEQPRTVDLGALDSSACRELLAALLPHVEQRGSTLSELAERSDGIPLYAEELALAYRASVSSVQSTAHGHRPPEPNTVPPTLRDLLLKRLDETGAATRTAQFASALGREFTLELLAKLSDTDEFELVGDLEQLVTAELVVKRLRIEAPSYMFRHALIRDTAYDSMPPVQRQRTHERIARGLEHHFAELAELQPDVLAHHFERARHPSKALSYWQAAARNSNTASAHGEALAQLERAFAQLQALEASPERTLAEAELLIAKGATIVARQGYSDSSAAKAFERVHHLIPPGSGALHLAFAARWGLWYSQNTQARLDDAWNIAQELMAMAEQANDTSLRVCALQARCETSFCVGKFDESIRASRHCEKLYDFQQHRHLAVSRGDDPLLASLSFEAFAQLLEGRPTEAIRRVSSALTLCERLGYPGLTAGMRGQAAWLCLIWGSSGASTPQLSDAHRHASLAIDIATENGFPFWEMYGRMIGAAAAILAGDLEARATLLAGSNLWRAVGAGLGRCWQLAFLSRASRHGGDYDQALALLGEALQFCRQTNSRYFEPELHRQLGELLLDPDNPARDEARGLSELGKAKDAAHECGATWWALAACVTQMRHCPQMRREGEAELRRLLTMFEASELEPPLVRDARAMLR